LNSQEHFIIWQFGPSHKSGLDDYAQQAVGFPGIYFQLSK
jgi:hypothetical protein